jgi:hypothetical protein
MRRHLGSRINKFQRLQLAQAIDYAPSKALLLEMAQQWVEMAEFARRREAKAEDAALPIAIPQLEMMASQ